MFYSVSDCSKSPFYNSALIEYGKISTNYYHELKSLMYVVFLVWNTLTSMPHVLVGSLRSDNSDVQEKVAEK